MKILKTKTADIPPIVVRRYAFENLPPSDCLANSLGLVTTQFNGNTEVTLDGNIG